MTTPTQVSYQIMLGEVQFGFPVYNEEEGVMDGEDDYAQAARELANRERAYHERFRQQHVGLPELNDDDDDEPVIGEDGLFYFAEKVPRRKLLPTPTTTTSVPRVVTLNRREAPASLQSHVALVHELLNAIIRNGDENIGGGGGGGPDMECILQDVLKHFRPESVVAKEQRTYKDDVSGFTLKTMPSDETATLDQVAFTFSTNAMGQYPFAIVLVGQAPPPRPETEPTILLMYGGATAPCFVMESRWDASVLLVVCEDAFDASQFVCDRYSFDKLVTYTLSRETPEPVVVVVQEPTITTTTTTTTPELPKHDQVPFDDEGCVTTTTTSVPPPGPVPQQHPTAAAAAEPSPPPPSTVQQKPVKPVKLSSSKKRTIVAKPSDVAPDESTAAAVVVKKTKTETKKPIGLASMVVPDGGEQQDAKEK